jgi:N-methylhydantoinase B
MDGVHVHMTNTRNTPTEVIEIAYPLRVERYALVPDSDGPGRFRGGLGLTREITAVDHEATITIGTERRKIRPWGLLGGKPGGPSDSWLVSHGEKTTPLSSKITTQVKPGTRIVLKTAGGGGFGDPFDRHPQEVCKDVMEGLISLARAKSEYGVVIHPESGQVDEEATQGLRRKPSSK